MKVGNLKGAMLEYFVRHLFESCGFTDIKADSIYTFDRGGIFYVNGKGAAHDADVIMDPPIQIPFTYPTQVIFECKAYGPTTGLTVIRNAFGFRNDINDFEIVTKQILIARQNNRRPVYAIENRKRHLFQVGVASINDFTKPAIEFAAHNKIPIFSLSWFVDRSVINKLNAIDQRTVDIFNDDDTKNVYDYFKDRDAQLYHEKYGKADIFLNSTNVIAEVFTSITNTIKEIYVATLETGDILFLRLDRKLFHREENHYTSQIHYSFTSPRKWTINLYNENNELIDGDFSFHLPNSIFNEWKSFNLNKSSAINMKSNYFSRIFVFKKNQTENRSSLPFFIISIDNNWLRQVRTRDSEEFDQSEE